MSWANAPVPPAQPGGGLTFDDLLQPPPYLGLSPFNYANASTTGSMPYGANASGASTDTQPPSWTQPQSPQPAPRSPQLPPYVAPFSLASAIAMQPAPAAPTGYRLGWNGPFIPGSASTPPGSPYPTNPYSAPQDLSGASTLPGTQPPPLSFNQVPVPQPAPFSSGAGPSTQPTRTPDVRLNWNGPLIHVDPYPPVAQPTASSGNIPQPTDKPSPNSDSEDVYVPFGEFPLLTPAQSEDALKSGGIGVVKGAIKLGGLPADVLTGFGYFPKNLFLNNYLTSQGLEQLPPDAPDALDPLRSEGIKSLVESHTGKFYEPRTPLGNASETIGELVPSGVFGPTLGLLGDGYKAVRGTISASELASAALARGGQLAQNFWTGAVLPGAAIQGVGDVTGSDEAKRIAGDVNTSVNLARRYGGPAMALYRMIHSSIP